MDPLHPKGELPTTEEMLAYMLATAGLINRLVDRDVILQDESARLLKKLNDADQRFDALGKELRGKYAPGAVIAAVRQAEATIVGFSEASREAAGELRQSVAASTRQFWIRTGGAIFASLVIGALVAGAAWKFVPSIDEVKARRAIIDSAIVKVVPYQGKQWARLKDSHVEYLCTGDKQEHCYPYGRVK